ncbi:ABC transporter ATP-binding protein [Clostridium sp. BL-8]|uniref:ABC transporter ATP-binding protein n=1 Tax=Clostridium sp. BL-8 TaxID=349938 RepID=UPI0009CDD171|nr:ABC transporter ATP-binding protein [Clostridium sp. BL-8]OOM69019.1 ABC-type transporter ATP-binding protein EcsA [Clostridium sp. BL-8]
MNILSLKNIKKKYNNKEVLDIETLDIESGKIYGYLGRNGAGKSTTIKIIMGIELPDHGQVCFMDKQIDYKNQEYKKFVGYCPDYPAVFEKLTVFEHLNFIAYLYGMDNDKEIKLRINKYLTHYEMNEYEDTLIETLSRGNKQKVSIISSIIHNPLILIYDEPTLGLDPISIKQFKDMLREYVRDGKTVFLSSHALNIIEEIADVVTIIERGKIVRKNISVKNIRDNLTSMEDYLISAIEN